ncbi:MAG: FtsX-like permease family protein, partial [Thermoproteota archaeon]
LGFICLSLVVLILIFMSNEITGIIKELRKKLIGVSFMQVDTLGSIIVSFSLAIENMRKRKFRSILVIFSLTVITFAAASFVSISPIKTVRKIPVQSAEFVQASYQGILITGTDFFVPINPMISSVVSNIGGGNIVVSSRALIPVSTGGSYVYNDLGKQILVAGVFGFTPEEREVLHLQDTILPNYNGVSVLKTWFSEDDYCVCYITEDIAKELAVKPGDDVVFYGIRLKVLGVISQQFLRNITDIDGIPVAPFDPLITRPPRPRVYWGIVFIPYKLAIDLGGITYSVALKCDDSPSVIPIAEKITNYLGLTSHYVFVVENIEYNKSFRYTSEKIFDISNWQFSLIPMIICTLVLLSTMTGAVYERIKDIYTYSVIGLNPMNVVGMFLSESVAYALISAPLGYVFSSLFGHFSDVLANYASFSVIIVISSSILIILLSSIYPLIKVSKIVTPSLERVWRPPTKPKENTWDIPLPIALETEGEVRGMFAFITNYLKSYGSEATSFMIEKLECEKKVEENMNIYESSAIVKLRPYETGLMEEMILKASRVKNRYGVILTANLVSGPRTIWIGSHLKVVDIVRKTMLIWKSLSEEEKQRFLKLGEEMFK